MLYSQFLKSIFHVIYGKPRELTQDESDRANLVLVADGVGGLDLCGTALRHVIAAEGLPARVEVIPWGHGFGRWHADLTNVVNRDAQARIIADRVIAFQAGGGGGSVFLVGKSGGTGLVVKALEMLPEGAVETAVLLAPAISPNYELGKALEAVRNELVVFWSPFDVFVLGVGTKVFGTIDRVRSSSAGLVGFRSRDGEQHIKLRQVRWRPEMATTGNLGGHVGPDSPAFLRKYVVPLLRPGGV